MPRRPQRPRLVTGHELATTIGEPLSAPEPPKGLSARSLQAWNEFWSSPVTRLIVPDLDVPVVELLFQLRDERDRAFRVAKRQRLVPGSQGQSVLNPLLGYAINVQREVRAIEDRFGVSPKARLMLGVLFRDAGGDTDSLNAALADDDAAEDPDILDRDEDPMDGSAGRVPSAPLRKPRTA